MIQTARSKAFDSAGEIGWGMLFFCCGLSGCLTVLVPGASLMKLAAGLLLVLCGLFAQSFVPPALRRYIAWTHSCDGVHHPAKKYARWGILISVVLAVGGTIQLFHLMLPEMAQLKRYEALHPGALNLVPDRLLLFMFVVPGAMMYLRACSLNQHRWKWFLLPLIVLMPVGLDFCYPGNFSLIMLFLGLVWLVSGGATLYSDFQHYATPPAVKL